MAITRRLLTSPQRFALGYPLGSLLTFHAGSLRCAPSSRDSSLTLRKHPLRTCWDGPISFRILEVLTHADLVQPDHCERPSVPFHRDLSHWSCEFSRNSTYALQVRITDYPSAR